MKKLYFLLATLFVCSMGLIAQSSWLAPETSYKANDVFVEKSFTAHDIIGNVLYAIDDDGLHSYDLSTQELISNYGTAPSSYIDQWAWPSFVTADPDGEKVWVGYTMGGLTDDRIYSVDLITSEWAHVATFPGNFDMEIYNGNYYVSGLNTEGWDGENDVNCISLLDISGENQHKRLIEIGGNSVGLAVDTQGNIYNAKYDPTGTETYLYKWSADAVQGIIDATDGSFLKIEDGTLLTAMPNNGPNDCAVDDAGNLLFNCNDFASGSFLAVWNGTSGNAHNYSKIGTYGGSSFGWFSMLKAKGDITKGGKAYMINFGDPIAEIYLSAPQVTKSLGIISGYNGDDNVHVDLSDYLLNLDISEQTTYEIVSNSFSEVASAILMNENILEIAFLEAGQTNILVKATSNGQSITEKLIVGVQPKITGDYVVSNFEDLILENESFWDGSDGSGGFVSGLARFNNSYSGGFWNDWAYSNLSDNTTSGYTNQFSAITGAGFDPVESEGNNYGVAYISSDYTTFKTIPLALPFKDDAAHSVKGLFVTNSTYAALSMEEGDSFTKKLGGDSGNDPDYLKLSVWGVNNGVATDAVEFYLADYRFEDNYKDYILKTWQWVELSSLGEVEGLFFNLESTDVGDYGMNTPSYFNIDNLYILPIVTGVDNISSTNIVVYPNPSNGVFRIQTENLNTADVRIYNMQGTLIYEEKDYSNSQVINISSHSSGPYIIQLSQEDSIITKTIITK